MLGDGLERAQLGKVIALHHVDTIDYPRSMRRRRDMSAVLDVMWGPKLLSRSVVTLVEERVEGLEDECLVLFRCGAGHEEDPCCLPKLSAA